MANMMQQIFLMNVDELLRNYIMFRAFNRSDAVINMRIPSVVADKLKELAAQKNVPYQTLITATLFSLVDVPENQKTEIKQS
jgi:predicted DNA binding CopG/RHH family protein